MNQAHLRQFNWTLSHTVSRVENGSVAAMGLVAPRRPPREGPAQLLSQGRLDWATGRLPHRPLAGDSRSPLPLGTKKAAPGLRGSSESDLACFSLRSLVPVL